MSASPARLLPFLCTDLAPGHQGFRSAPARQQSRHSPEGLKIQDAACTGLDIRFEQVDILTTAFIPVTDVTLQIIEKCQLIPNQGGSKPVLKAIEQREVPQQSSGGQKRQAKREVALSLLDTFLNREPMDLTLNPDILD
jgi:hypothetical protein